ncbi:hypothetical protein [Hymenobacter sp.]|uniref:hypothetical protein n=1 Tax=Hymenobacter sp. TaxID=1898978 RepID=UPI00286CC711|nr:hypothetical protein [Hymenobacter sp.]
MRGFIELTISGSTMLIALNAIATVRTSGEGCKIELLVSEKTDAKSYYPKESYEEVLRRMQEAF